MVVDFITLLGKLLSHSSPSEHCKSMASFSIDAILGNSEPKHEESSPLETQDLLQYSTREDELGRKGINLYSQSPYSLLRISMKLLA